MRRGEVWWATLGQPWRRRPVLLLSRDAVYGFLTHVTVAPLTTTIRSSASMVALTPVQDRVHQMSVVNLDNILTVPVELLTEPVTVLRPEKMREVERAIHFALALSD